MAGTWWRVPPAGMRGAPARRPTRRAGSPVSTTRSVSIGPRRCRRRRRGRRGAQAGERAVLPDVDLCGDERCGVGQHVARRVDVAVARRVRRAHRDAGRQAGVRASSRRAGEPFDLRPRLAAARCGHAPAAPRLGEARHQITLRDEPAVEREPVAAGGVELLARRPSTIAGSVPPCARTMPAARLLAPSPSVRLLEQDDALLRRVRRAEPPSTLRPFRRPPRLRQHVVILRNADID